MTAGLTTRRSARKPNLLTLTARIRPMGAAHVVSQSEIAQLLDRSVQQIREYARRGMPTETSGKTPRYDVGHVTAWFIEFEIRTRQNGGKGPSSLTLQDAIEADLERATTSSEQRRSSACRCKYDHPLRKRQLRLACAGTCATRELSAEGDDDEL